MKVAVVSDTHRYSNELNDILKLIQNTDVLIHLGDNVEDAEKLKNGYLGKVINVKGNCDFTNKISSEALEDIDGLKVLITHGHKYNVKTGLLALRYRAKELGVDIVLFGHTHQALEIYEEGILYVNPGSPALPRGPHKTIAVLDIKDKIPKVNFITIS